MVDNYAIILIMILTVLGAGVVLLSLGILVRPHRPTKRKLSPYESGVPDVEPLKGRYTPRYYVIAILFVIFDIEAVFLYPWAVAFDRLGLLWLAGDGRVHRAAPLWLYLRLAQGWAGMGVAEVRVGERRLHTGLRTAWHP